jgi:hypothetical protein
MGEGTNEEAKVLNLKQREQSRIPGIPRITDCSRKHPSQASLERSAVKSQAFRCKILAMSASGNDDDEELDYDFSDLPQEAATPPAPVPPSEDATSVLASKKLLLRAGENSRFTYVYAK